MRDFFKFFGCLVVLLTATATARSQPQMPPTGVLHQARYGPCAVALTDAKGAAIYVTGGVTPTEIANTIERIDATTGVSQTLTAPLIRRFFATAESAEPYVYLFGGQDEDAVLTTLVERLDTRDLSVKTLAPLPEGLRIPSSAIVGDKIYLAGGSHGNGVRSADLWIYDIAADAWTPGAPMLLGKECDLVARDNTLYAVAGFDGRGATRDFEAYDIATDKWQALPPLPFIMSAHHGAIVGDTLWEFGDYAELGRVSAYDFDAGKWRQLENTGYTPRRHTAAFAFDGKVWVIGGNTASSNASAQEAIERFDPLTEAFVPFP